MDHEVRTKIEELPGETIEYDDVGLTTFRTGVNEVDVRLASVDPARTTDLVLQQIRVDVKYG